MIHFSVYSSPLNNFYCLFYYLTSEHLAPSSGLKSQLIFIILLYKKVRLYLQHLRIYWIKYWYLISMNRYNIVTQNITILRCIDCFPHRYWADNRGACFLFFFCPSLLTGAAGSAIRSLQLIQNAVAHLVFNFSTILRFSTCYTGSLLLIESR